MILVLNEILCSLYNSLELFLKIWEYNDKFIFYLVSDCIFIYVVIHIRNKQSFHR